MKQIKRDRYGKHMKELLAIVSPHPGVWHTLSRENVVVQAAKTLVRKGLVEMSADGKQIRFLPGSGTEKLARSKPDGWIVAEKMSDEVRVIEDEALVKGLLHYGYAESARPFRYIE
jgi:hypothetical protein